ncbi:MAG: flagellar export protein FliJ [Oscillospiraceae bacterium]
MKKFSFSLEAVHRFKGQILDSLLNEMAIISAEVIKQEKVIQTKNDIYKQSNCEFNEKNRIGMTILEITYRKEYLKRLQKEIELEEQKLEQLRATLEAKKAEVVEARKENLSLEKLKEKKLEEYNAMVAKTEETVVEEFVVNSMTAAKR